MNSTQLADSVEYFGVFSVHELLGEALSNAVSLQISAKCFDGTQAFSPRNEALFIDRLDELLNLKRPLVRLAGLIDWAEFEPTFSVSFTSGPRRPTLPPRLAARLLYLQHTFNTSDEAVVNTWIKNPYWQYFCCEVYLQTHAPIDPSSLTRCRKCIDEEGLETLLMITIEAARRGSVVRACRVARVIVDTTVIPRSSPIRRKASYSSEVASMS